MESWILPLFLILLMQGGFALVETGLCRAKNAAHTMSLNFLAPALGMIAFWAIGFALMCGGAAHGAQLHSAGGWGNFSDATALTRIWGFRAGSHWWGIVGGRGFFLGGNYSPQDYDAIVRAFLCAALYMTVAVTIPTGALVERWSLRSFFVITLLNGAVIFPIYGCWIWGGGWLAQLGHHLGLGNGAIDYAGSSAVHLLGGSLALAGARQIGPRIGKYDEAGNPRAIFGHDVPMVLFGTLLLAFCWLGFNTSHSLVARDGRAAVVAVNTLLCSAAGALAAGVYMWRTYGKPDPSLMCNGMLGALVASSAGCAFVAPWAAFLTGLVAGVLTAWGVLLLERKGIDDPVGAISVHGLSGLWGMIALGLFANGSFGAGAHHVDSPVRGLFYGGARQLVAQLIASAICIAWAMLTGGLAFSLIRALLGSNRVSVEAEIAGLDIPEMGAGAYPEFISRVAPEQVPLSEIIAARRG